VPVADDIPFELKNYAQPRTLVVGVADRRTGADALVILSGTVILPPHVGRHGGAEGRIERKRVRFVLPQSPKVLTAAAQVRSMQGVTGVASFHYEGQGDRTIAIDQSLIEWADDLKELRVTIDTAVQGPGSTILRVTYNAFVLAQIG
jgi:hypothetical protein